MSRRNSRNRMNCQRMKHSLIDKILHFLQLDNKKEALKKMWKNDLEKIILVSTTFITILTFLIQKLIYFFQSTKLIYYKVSNVNIDQDGLLLDFWSIFPYTLILIFVNVIVACLILKKRYNTLMVLLLIEFLIEIWIMTSIVSFDNNIRFDKAIKLIYKSVFTLKLPFTLYIQLIGILITINSIGLIVGIVKRGIIDELRARVVQRINVPALCVKCLFGFIVLSILISGYCSLTSVADKKSYYVVIQPTKVEKNIHIFEKSYIVYAIVYERKNDYILKPLINKRNKAAIDLDIQKIISKENVQTYYIKDISNILEIRKAIENTNIQ